MTTTLDSQKRLIQLHTNLIQIGKELEGAGLFDVAIKVAETALLMCDYLEAKSEEDVKIINQIRALLPIVVKRIEARIRDAD